MDKVKIMALGGLDEDGKDLYVIEINDAIFVVNAGFKYPTRMTPGIDFIIADFSYLKENKNRIKAYILPKTKKNSFGALPYIYKECPAPIYCTLYSKIAITRFAEHYEQLSDFDFHLVSLPSKVMIGGYEFEFFSTCASVPMSYGLSIKTSLGNIVYSGDFIVEYTNDKYFKLDLNTVGKIAENPTLILLSDSSNAGISGYCSPVHKLYPFFMKCFADTVGRCFVAVSSDNLYHISELFKACNDSNKKICFYDDLSKSIYDPTTFGEQIFPPINVVSIDDILRTKETDLVIVMADEDESLYEKISLLASGENEAKQVKISPNDTFIMGLAPTDNNEVIATSTIDEIYKAGCQVKYIKKKDIHKMHACEEDLKMLISLLKPKYYFPIEGYYVNLLANAKMAFDMQIGLSHNNIFLLDNGQSLNINANGATPDFNSDNKHPVVGDVMIDGIGVGDVVNEIINDRTRLSEDGVVVLGCAVSKSSRKIVCGPDVQMRGFLFLKDKDADSIIKEITQMYVTMVNDWVSNSKEFENNQIESKVKDAITKYIKKLLNREPVIRPNIIVLE
jgi:Predicted hydrolase of the metallo-beta-lactamase superfamily